MKKTFLIIALLSFVLAGCTRRQPDDNPTGPDGPGNGTLEPLQVIDLLPDIPEPSGLAYHPIRHSLMVVSDSRPDIFEIDFDGQLITTIPAAGSDLEGIAVSKTGDTLYVVEERNHLVASYTTAGTRLGSFLVDVATLDNSSLEGVAVDSQGHLWVLNEKEPRLLLEFAGAQELGRREITFVSDLSDICADNSDDTLWIISDESLKIIHISRSGALLAEWTLPFSKGEGIAFANGRMYIVNDETSRLYVFSIPG